MHIKNLNEYDSTVIKAIDDKSEELRSISLKVRYNVNSEMVHTVISFKNNSYYIIIDSRKTGIRSIILQNIPNNHFVHYHYLTFHKNFLNSLFRL